MSILLKVVRAGGVSQDISLPFGSYVIGRESGDIVLNDPLASALHARIDAHPRGVTVTDLGSSNGTFDSEGRPILTTTRIHLDQSIQIGNSQITLAGFIAPAGGTLLGPSSAAPGATSAFPQASRWVGIHGPVPEQPVTPGPTPCGPLGAAPRGLVASEMVQTIRTSRPGLAGGLMLACSALLLCGVATNWLVVIIGNGARLTGFGVLGVTHCTPGGTCVDVTELASLFALGRLQGVFFDSMSNLSSLLNVVGALVVAIAGCLAFINRSVSSRVVIIPSVLSVVSLAFLAAYYGKALAPTLDSHELLVPGPSAFAALAGAAVAALVQLVMLRPRRAGAEVETVSGR